MEKLNESFGKKVSRMVRSRKKSLTVMKNQRASTTRLQRFGLMSIYTTKDMMGRYS
jgi:hypothetical protein